MLTNSLALNGVGQGPAIIQGGMGVSVSNWCLANAVARCGQMGVVSGTGVDTVLVRRLQMGDPGEHMRRALERFPVREMAERIYERYFVPGGKDPNRPFKSKPMPSADLPQALNELLVVANFAEVTLAKEGHRGLVGLNLLEKIQIPTLPSLFGAMLANVDYVLMGAGIPRQIPGALDRLAEGNVAELRIDVAGAQPGDDFHTRFDPRAFLDAAWRDIVRPRFLAIISSATLAVTLARKSTGRVDGFIVEGSTAGGHNAPPRGGIRLDETGQPIYGTRDVADLGEIAKIGLPFWLAGSYAEPEKLREAQAAGAEGIQVGTAFAFCEESGIEPVIKQRVIQQALLGDAEVYTDPLASPTGFPFKVFQMPGTLAKADVYQDRTRICDLGYLRTPYRLDDGKLGYRCASEPIEDYVRKGGEVDETVGRKCVCNGLMTTAGYPQRRKDGTDEPPLVTAGDEVNKLARFLPKGETTYRAEDVIAYLLGHRSNREALAAAVSLEPTV